MPRNTFTIARLSSESTVPGRFIVKNIRSVSGQVMPLGVVLLFVLAATIVGAVLVLMNTAVVAKSGDELLFVMRQAKEAVDDATYSLGVRRDNAADPNETIKEVIQDMLAAKGEKAELIEVSDAKQDGLQGSSIRIRLQKVLVAGRDRGLIPSTVPTDVKAFFATDDQAPQGVLSIRCNEGFQNQPISDGRYLIPLNVGEEFDVPLYHMLDFRDLFLNARYGFRHILTGACSTGNLESRWAYPQSFFANIRQTSFGNTF